MADEIDKAARSAATHAVTKDDETLLAGCVYPSPAFKTVVDKMLDAAIATAREGERALCIEIAEAIETGRVTSQKTVVEALRVPPPTARHGR